MSRRKRKRRAVLERKRERRAAAHEQIQARREGTTPFEPREEPAPHRIWGEGLEPEAVAQLLNACALPVSFRGAFMPDAHVGYGLPIGGVLATEGAVIPYAVGTDIACRMRLSVLDLPVGALGNQRDTLKQALVSETRFGLGATFRDRRDHPVMDEDWDFSAVVREVKDRAWAQLGTSGSGNHFVEYGTLEVLGCGLELEPGKYLALLSHSGSRGPGNHIANHFSTLARRLRSELPTELAHLAWLDLDSEAGQEYWAAMELMGRYAAANHELIHRGVASALGAKPFLSIQNHHNFAWKERHYDRDVIVHRKGATPAAERALGIISGSMATPGFVVRGRGEPESLCSASHGAGRAMSRKAAKKKLRWHDVKRMLKRQGVELIAAGLDEAPMAYKDIDQVMAAQKDLVEILARFDPRLVRMAPGSERAED